MKTLNANLPTHPQRREMIALAAYYLAESRGFAPGKAEDDWLQAEQVIDAMIADHQLSRSTGMNAGRTSIRNALQSLSLLESQVVPDLDG